MITMTCWSFLLAFASLCLKGAPFGCCRSLRAQARPEASRAQRSSANNERRHRAAGTAPPASLTQTAGEASNAPGATPSGIIAVNHTRSVEPELAQDADVVVDARPHRKRERHPQEQHAAGVEVDLEASARDRIAVVEEERLEREHLEDHLVFAELLRGERDAAARGDAAEARDGELAQHEHHHHPCGHARP